ncbi:hypothetical protein Bca4012_083339 [Brassica carinata]
MESVLRICRFSDEPVQSLSLNQLVQQMINLTKTEKIALNTQITEDESYHHSTQEAVADTNQNEDITETPNGSHISSRRGRQPRRRSAIENVVEN